VSTVPLVGEIQKLVETAPILNRCPVVGREFAVAATLCQKARKTS